LHPVGKLFGGARKVFEVWEAATRDAPDALTTQFGFVTTPDGTKVCAIFACFNGEQGKAEKTLAPLMELEPPLADGMTVMSYADVQNIFTPGFPAGRKTYWKSHFVDRLEGETVDILLKAYTAAPAPSGGIIIEQISGQARRVAPDATAFVHRNARFSLIIAGVWDDAAENDARKQWVRETWAKTKPFSSGSVYVNYLDDVADESGERVKAAYGAETYARLARLKRKFDPQNLFRLNQNIQP
jgi:hypothetical protein